MNLHYCHLRSSMMHDSRVCSRLKRDVSQLFWHLTLLELTSWFYEFLLQEGMGKTIDIQSSGLETQAKSLMTSVIRPDTLYFGTLWFHFQNISGFCTYTSLVSIWSWMCRNSGVNVVEIEKESISTTVTTCLRPYGNQAIFKKRTTLSTRRSRFKIFPGDKKGSKTPLNVLVKLFETTCNGDISEVKNHANIQWWL